MRVIKHHEVLDAYQRLKAMDNKRASWAIAEDAKIIFTAFQYAVKTLKVFRDGESTEIINLRRDLARAHYEMAEDREQLMQQQTRNKLLLIQLGQQVEENFPDNE